MLLNCKRCKKDTLHRSKTESGFPGDSFVYKVCNDCGEIYLPLFGYKERDKKNETETKKSI